MKARHGIICKDRRKVIMHGKDIVDGDGSADFGLPFFDINAMFQEEIQQPKVKHSNTMYLQVLQFKLEKGCRSIILGFSTLLFYRFKILIFHSRPSSTSPINKKLKNNDKGGEAQEHLEELTTIFLSW